MKRSLLLFLFITFLCACQKDLLHTIPKPVEFTPAKVSEFSLSNGLRVYFLKDKEIPIVRGVFYIPHGSLWESEEEKGNFGAMGSLMRGGGAGSLSSDELDQKLEQLSASIGTGVGGEYGTIGFSCLSIDVNEVLKLTADVIRFPRFEEKKIALWRSQAKESIYRRVDSPETIADIAFTEILYAGTPFGRTITSSDVDKITRERLIDAHRRLIQPDGVRVAVSGDIEQDQLKDLLEKHFGNWKSTTNYHFAPLTIKKRNLKKAFYFIEKPFSQATVLVGLPGPARLPEDYSSIDAFNAIFGSDGGFGSRLMQQVRTNEGLAYSVVGGIYPGYLIGKNMIGLQTKSESAGTALREAESVLNDLKEKFVLGHELDEAVNGTINSFVFKFDTTDDLVQRAVLLELLQYPSTYDSTYIEKLTQVTPANIREVAKKYWNEDNMVVVVVGNKGARKSIEQTFPNNVIIELGFNETTIFPN